MVVITAVHLAPWHDLSLTNYMVVITAVIASGDMSPAHCMRMYYSYNGLHGKGKVYKIVRESLKKEIKLELAEMNGIYTEIV